MVSFKIANTKTEVTVWYAIDGAPTIEHKSRMLLPTVARFVFRDDDGMADITEMFLNAKIVRKSGEVSEVWQQVPDLYLWNQGNWPQWLVELYRRAINDYHQNHQNHKVPA